jgi:hypothetical protein
LRSVAGLAVIFFLLVAASASGGGSPIKVVPAIPSGTTYRCSGAQIKLFDNSNGGGVQNGGKPATFSTGKKTYCLASITTYHWNNGQGAAPGSIGLKVVSGLGGKGNTLGPLAATGSAGQGGAQNVNWTVTAAQPIVLNGSYACQDSDPASWSQNPASKSQGFCTVTVTNATPTKPVKPAKPTYVCLGSQVKLFDNSNGGGVQNGGKPPSFTTYGTIGVTAWCLNSITTYHWNNGTGAKPGTIGLGPLNFGAVVNPVAPRQATGSAGQGGTANVNWTVNYSTTNPTIVSGAYTCKDSDPATWAQNQATGGKGFCIVYATPAYVSNFTLPSGLHVGRAPSPPAPATGGSQTTSTAHIKCFTGTLSTMLLYPINVPADQWGLLLLQCGIKQGDGFQGRLTPTSMFVIPRGCGPFWTFPFASGNPPPPVFIQYTGQPNAPCSTAKEFIPFKVRNNWRIDIQARDAVTQAPLRPAGYGVYIHYGGGDVQAQNTWNVK